MILFLGTGSGQNAKKKMTESHPNKIQNFLPAVVKNYPSIGYVVECYVLDPDTENFLKKRIKLSRLVYNRRRCWPPNRWRIT